MECIEDVRNILAGINHAQGTGCYKLEESAALAAVFRRVMARYPELSQAPPPRQQQQESPQPQPVQQPVQRSTQPVQPQQTQKVEVVEETVPEVDIADTIETISLPIQ